MRDRILIAAHSVAAVRGWEKGHKEWMIVMIKAGLLGSVFTVVPV